MDRLMASAAAADIVVFVCRLPDDLLGCWDPELRRIFIDSRLTPVEQRVVLAHELGHAHHRHLCGGDLPLSVHRRQEHQADVFAARLLINAAEYARLEAIDPDQHHLADELDVTVDLVHVYEAACLTRVRGVTYSHARDGIGQWAHRVEVA